MLQQVRDVFRMLAERGDEQTDDVEAIKQIGAERVGSNAFEHVRTGRGHESRTAAGRAALEKLQQLHLHRDGELLDSVNEQRAVLRLGDRLRKSPMTRDDEWVGAAAASLVNETTQGFLPGAALS